MDCKNLEISGSCVVLIFCNTFTSLFLFADDESASDSEILGSPVLDVSDVSQGKTVLKVSG